MPWSRLHACAAAHPHLEAILTALSAPRIARLRNALSLFTSSVRVAYATAYLETRAVLSPGTDSDRGVSAAAAATTLRAHALAFIACLAQAPPRKDHPQEPARRDLVIAQIRSVTSPARDSDPPPPSLTPDPVPNRPGPRAPFSHSTHLCLAALCSGWEVAETTQMWARVESGTFSADGRTFIPGPLTPQSPSRDWTTTEVRTISPSPGEAPVHVYVSYGQIVALVSPKKLRVRPRHAPGATPLTLSDLPSFIALPRDSEGRPIIPKSRVTALVEAQEAWHQELGSLDSVSSAIVRGLLVMPKIATPSKQKSLRNHPSWEDDPEAQAALGPIIAKWLTQGVLEYVQWDDRHPVLLQPCGAVPKGSAPFYRLITDARFGNSMYSDWGVSYSSAADLSAALQPRDFTWSADLQDAYHLSVFAGCGGELRPCKRPVPQADGSVSWIDGYIVGCSPDTCLGGCDKDMSGISISGHIFRFAACQFGQKTAGSPLNCLVLSIAQYFCRLPDPVHVASWVDDLHFSMRTPDHPPCNGHLAGCPVCTKAYHRAVAAEALWHQKARALNLPLSLGKGHSVAQGGPFTGVFIDTLAGRYSMLAEKLASLRATFVALVNADASTPRLLAQGRGKASHYGCAIPLLAAACPALTQAMHQAEHAFDLPPPSLTEEAADVAFDWDHSIPLSTRTKATLRLMLRIIDDLGTAGQPIWPIPAASAHGHFLSTSALHTPAVSVSALVHVSAVGWGLTARTHPDSPPIVFGGPWGPARALISADWMAVPAFLENDCPSQPEHQLALAALMGLNALALSPALRALPIVLRIPHKSVIRALQAGSSTDPALQDIAMLIATICLETGTTRPWFLASSPPIAPLPLTPAALLTASLDSSSPRLQALVHDMALAAGSRITIDLFATATNALCPRFYSFEPEPLADGADALAQATWASSACPWCHQDRPDFVLLFPPHTLLRPALAKARLDRAQGIAIVPCAPTTAWWPPLMAASQTRVNKRQPYIKIRSDSSNLVLGSSPPGYFLAVLHFDFWSDPDSRPRACLHGHLPRPPHPGQTASDAAEALLVHAHLETCAPHT